MNRKCKELIPEKRIMTYLSPLVKCVCVCGGGGMQTYSIGRAKKVFTHMPLLQGKIFKRLHLKRANM